MKRDKNYNSELISQQININRFKKRRSLRSLTSKLVHRGMLSQVHATTRRIRLSQTIDYKMRTKWYLSRPNKTMNRLTLLRTPQSNSTVSNMEAKSLTQYLTRHPSHFKLSFWAKNFKKRNLITGLKNSNC